MEIGQLGSLVDRLGAVSSEDFRLQSAIRYNGRLHNQPHPVGASANEHW